MTHTNIKTHPIFPFIEIGTRFAFAKRYGFCGDAESLRDSDEWSYRFTIDFPSGCAHCQSEDHAQEVAERDFFLNEVSPDAWREAQKQAIADGRIDLALAMAERYGYWRGVESATESMKNALKPHVSALHGMLGR